MSVVVRRYSKETKMQNQKKKKKEKERKKENNHLNLLNRCFGVAGAALVDRGDPGIL